MHLYERFGTALLLGLGATVGASECAPTAHLQNGTVLGGKCKDVNVNSFFSIPYAKAPVGDLRFAPPQPYDKTFGVLNGTAPAPACIQFDKTFGETGPQSEDCLFVDVWAPASAAPDSKLPVKVWLYGGSNMAGGISNPTYDGCHAAVDSILVSVNYRVGPLGFLALKGLGLGGNFGSMDQMLALRWVQENIPAFGGDPTKVLLVGQSAGAMDTYTLASREEAPQVMRAAAMQSGGGRDLPTIDRVQRWQTRFADGLNCSTTDLSCFRAAPTSALQSAVAAMPKDPVVNTYTPLVYDGARARWGPVVDGTFLRQSPSAAGSRVPAIFGSTTNDSSLFVIPAFGRDAYTLNQTVYDAFLASNFGPLAARVNETFSAAKFGGKVYAAIEAVVTDTSYKCWAYQGARATADRGIPSYAYGFGHVPSCAWYALIPPDAVAYLGATHTAEIPFVFNTTRGLPAPGGDCALQPGEAALAHAMSRAWTSMAERGAPGGAGAAWPAFDEETWAGVNIGEAMEVGRLDYGSCALWAEIDAELQKIEDVSA
ncbi:alpha/beta-hydrolase [Apiospora rasikravindrae]|uniref:Carboxylic ester hydrolase n=1 Tax=Apiospora rasikravindrae TaxID=990691 RepID=A0ABR1S049_9PEZI